MRQFPFIRARAPRWCLWLPTILVLIFFLFHIEIAGAVTHLFYPAHYGNRRYRVHVPTHWFIENYGHEHGSDFFFWAISGTGIARSWKYTRLNWWWSPYAHIEAHLIDNDGKTNAVLLNNMFSDADVVASSRQSVSGGYMDCAEYRSRRPRRVPPERLYDRFVWHVCFGHTDESNTSLRLSFVGTPELVPEFYRFVRSRVEFH